MAALTEIELPEGLISIGQSAFCGCELTDVFIPSTVMNIGGAPFSGNPALRTITVSTQNTTYHSEKNCLLETKTRTLIDVSASGDLPSEFFHIGEYAFHNAPFTNYSIPDGVLSIGEGAFTGVEMLSIPASVTKIGSGFANSDTVITLDEQNPHYKLINNCLIETATGTLIWGNSRSVIPDDGSVKAIRNFAFENCNSLYELVIPESVNVIEGCSFHWCNTLTKLTFKGKLIWVGEHGFSEVRSNGSYTVVFEKNTEEDSASWHRNWNNNSTATFVWADSE